MIKPDENETFDSDGEDIEQQALFMGQNQLSIVPNENDLPKVVGDERRFKQILINLVKNALKFTLKGQIVIKASYDYEYERLIVHVVDSGAGIAKEDFSMLFSKFGKLQRTADLNNEGIGLGLTIVKQIVDNCGG